MEGKKGNKKTREGEKKYLYHTLKALEKKKRGPLFRQQNGFRSK